MISGLLNFWRRPKGDGADATLPIEVPDSRRQILVDISVIYQYDARTGIQRVVRAVWLILRGFESRTVSVRPVYASRKHGYAYARADFMESVMENTNHNRMPVRVKAGDVFLGLDLSAHIFPRWEKQIAAWRKDGTKIIMVVYDLLPHLEPQWFKAKTTRHFRKWLGAVSRQADDAICISDDVKRDLASYLSGASTGRVRTIDLHKIGLGSNIVDSGPSVGKPANAADILRLMRLQKTALMVGTIEPRKAHEVALRAFEHLWQSARDSAPNLIIVGKPGWKTEALQTRIATHPELGRRLFWFADASDEFLQELYHAATFLLMTSYAEGYGLPVIEALGQGLPVLSRDIPSVREISNARISFFSDDSLEHLSERILAISHEGKTANCDYSDERVVTWADTRNELAFLLALEAADRNKTAFETGAVE